jgi:hypothetical protein
MKGKPMLQFKSNHSTHSSLDSGHSQDEVITEKTRNLEEIQKIKEKLKNYKKENILGFTSERETSDWTKFYSKFMNEVVSNKNITSKEIELRINSVLNRTGVKDKLAKDEKKVCNKLQMKNKYEFCDKNKFIPTVMAKYNCYMNERKEEKVIKNSSKLKSLISTTMFTKSLLRKPTSKALGGVETKKSVIIRKSSNKLIGKNSIFVKSNFFSRHSTKNIGTFAKGLKINEPKASIEENKSIASSKNYQDSDDSFNYDRGNENNASTYPECKF